MRSYYIRNREYYLQCNKNYYIEHKQEIRESHREYYYDNIHAIKKWREQYYIDNRDYLKDMALKRYKDKNEYILEQQKQYRRANIDIIRYKDRLRHKRNRLRTKIFNTFNNKKKHGRRLR